MSCYVPHLKTPVKPLITLDIGKESVISSIRADTQTIAKLSSLGLLEGAVISLISMGFDNAPCIVNVKNSHIAISWGIASKIMVE
jgi:Fe2+ transport system protein FeoA